MAKPRKRARTYHWEAKVMEALAGIGGCVFIYKADTFIDLFGCATITALLMWMARDLGEYVHQLREEQKRAEEQQRLAAIKAEREAREREKEEQAEQRRREEVRKEREAQFQQRRDARNRHTIRAARQISMNTRPEDFTGRDWGIEDDGV